MNTPLKAPVTNPAIVAYEQKIVDIDIQIGDTRHCLHDLHNRRKETVREKAREIRREKRRMKQ